MAAKKKADAVQKEAVAGGGSQIVVRVPKLTAITFDTAPAIDKIQALSALLRDNEDKRAALEPCVRTYNAAIDNITKLRDELLITMKEAGLTVATTEVGEVRVLQHEGDNPQVRIGTTQIAEFIATKDATIHAAYVKFFAELRDVKAKAIIEFNKKANEAIGLPANPTPPPTFSIEVDYINAIGEPKHEAMITLEVPHVTAIKGVSWYNYRTLKAIEGKQIKCEYEKVTDTPHDENVRVREGKSYEEMHGWVKKNHGVWITSKGSTCIDLDNNYNRIVDGGQKEITVKDLRKSVTEEDIATAKAMGQLTNGMFRPTRLRVEGIKPGSLYWQKPDGQWEMVDIDR